MADPTPPRPSPSLPLPDKLFFDYIKSPQFRVVHADGAFGGLTPTGYVFVTLYTQRPPIPTRIAHAVRRNEQGQIKLGEEITEERVCRDGVVRDVEVGVVMDLTVATALRDWLNIRIEQGHELMEAAAAAAAAAKQGENE
jgi:hypothetical protein